MTTVVIVEDDALALMALSQVMESEGYEVCSFLCADTAYDHCVEHIPDILIADWSVPGERTTADLALALKNRKPDIKIIFISGYESSEVKGMARNLRDAECLSKPVQFDRFLNDLRG